MFRVNIVLALSYCLLSGCDSECNIEYRDIPTGTIEIDEINFVVESKTQNEVEIEFDISYTLEYKIEKQDVILRIFLEKEGISVADFDAVMIDAGEEMSCGEMVNDNIASVYDGKRKADTDIPIDSDETYVIVFQVSYNLMESYDVEFEEDRVLDVLEKSYDSEISFQ